MTRLLLTTMAAMLAASAAVAGPGGCGGRSHDATADAGTTVNPTPAAPEIAAAEETGTTPSIDMLALLNGALPSEALDGPVSSLR